MRERNWIIGLVVALLCCGGQGDAATLAGLGDLPGGNFESTGYVTGISGDGSAVVGHCSE